MGKNECPKCGGSEYYMDDKVAWRLTCCGCGHKYLEPRGYTWWWGHDDD